MAVSIKRRASQQRSGKKKRSTAWLDDSSVRGWGNEVLAIIFFAITAIFGVSAFASLLANTFTTSFIGYIGTTLLSAMGPIGGTFGGILVKNFGVASLIPVIWLGFIGRSLWYLDENPQSISLRLLARPFFGICIVVTVSCSLLALCLSHDTGGVFGQYLNLILSRNLGSVGSFILLMVILVAGISVATRLSIEEVLNYALIGLKLLISLFPALVITCAKLWESCSNGWNHAFSSPNSSSRIEKESIPIPHPRSKRKKDFDYESLQDDKVNEFAPFEKFDLGVYFEKTPKRVTKELSKLESQIKVDEEIPIDESLAWETVLDEENDKDESYSHVVVSRRQNLISNNINNLTKEDTSRKESLAVKKSNIKKLVDKSADYSGYKIPPVELLTKSEDIVQSEDDDELIQKSRQIELKLRDFNILGRVTEVHPGPVITLFEFEPAAGVKVGKIAALQDDLAMSLRATSIRIIAPIPRKGTVGIEVPNKNRDMVRLRDVLEHPEFLKQESILAVPLGKDTYGDPLYVDIATMPHLLMAGATGTGKSVSINALLVSLLYKASPKDLGLILIDPKILELSIYEGIPHLKVPVVTVPKQAKAVLDWAVKEMDRRYRMMQKYGVRNIDGYNRIILGDIEGKKDLSHTKVHVEDDIVVDGAPIILNDSNIIEESSENLESRSSIEEEPIRIVEELKPLPKIVIIIDELADLMLTVGRDIEELITRLAQKARAAGIHLILATQRPSVDVITGLIKANFPARLSFRVTSRIDSRTILDSMGAERLLGKGDMLFMQPGAQHLKRIHGAFVSDNEVQQVVDFVKAQAQPSYDQKIIDLCQKALQEDTEGEGASSETGIDEDDVFDPLYDKAVELVVLKGQASTSMIQRVFRIGYNRAARIIEMMEKEGVIGPMDGIKPREVLLTEVGKSSL